MKLHSYFIAALCLFLIPRAFAACLPPPTTAADLPTHACSAAAGQCAPSAVPPAPPTGSASPLPMATAFDNIANPMAACCGMGWGETDAANKFDCVEAIPPVAPTHESFLTFYNYGGTADPLTTAGLQYPNRMFALGRDGIPLNGFYDQTGKRCFYRKPSDKSPKTLSVPNQMALFDEALTRSKPPTPSALSGIDAEVDVNCCNLVILALERRCPVSDTIGTTDLARTIGGTRRCTAAKEMKLHFAVFDLCDPNIVHRARFNVSTSYSGEDPKFANIIRTDSIDVTNLVSEFYAQPSPLPSPIPCPTSSAFFEIPWAPGKCRLNAPEPAPTR